MKKLMTSLILLTGSANVTLAHSLPGDEGLMNQLDHQLLGLHHLPLTLLAIAAGVMLLRHWRLNRRW